MKKLIKLAMITFFFLPLPIWAQNQLLPVEISSYYTAKNFVVAFSTKQERFEMVQYISEKDLPHHLTSERQKIVFKKMQELSEMELPYDAEIYVPNGKPRMRSDFNGIIQIENVRYIDDETIEVNTVCYELDPETNTKLVSLYERDNETVFPENWDSSATILYRGTNKWINVNNCWLKKEAGILYINKYGDAK